jgi:hypothetical protein
MNRCMFPLRNGDQGPWALRHQPFHLNQKRIDLVILRDERKLGSKRIQAELLRHHDLRLSTTTIGKVLRTDERPLLVRRQPP